MITKLSSIESSANVCTWHEEEEEEEERFKAERTWHRPRAPPPLRMISPTVPLHLRCLRETRLLPIARVLLQL